MFIKSLDGKLMLVSFDDEDCVHDLHVRVAQQVGVSANQFILVFPSRTLSAAQMLAETVFQPESTIYKQGLLGHGLVSQFTAFGVTLREMGLGTFWHCGITFRSLLGSNSLSRTSMDITSW